MEGIDLEIVAKKFGRENMETMNRVADTFVSQQLLDRHDQHLVLSKKGKFLADGIAADLFF